MRVFLDTNVLVSAVATRGLCSDILHAVLTEHDLVIGETVLAELQIVLGRRLRVPPSIVEELVEFLRREAVVIRDAPSPGHRIRDPDDVVVLEEAVAGQVDVLVTGDHDVLQAAEGAPVRIVSPRGFWERLRDGEDS